MPRSQVTLADMDRVGQKLPPRDDRATHALPLGVIAPSPHNPRTDVGAIDELAASLDAHGLLQPILVRRIDGEAAGFEIIAGHRRYAAAAQLKWETIDCVIREAEPDEAFILTLVENLQRDDLSAREEAAGLEMLLRDRSWSTNQVAEAVKRSPSFISKRLRVFDDPILAPYVLRNQVPVSVAEETLTLGPSDRRTLIEQAANGQWTRADVRRAVVAILQPNLGRRPHGLTRLIRELRLTLERLLPQDLTEADRKELIGLFKAAQVTRKKVRVGPPILPTIAPSGRVFLADQEDVVADLATDESTTKHDGGELVARATAGGGVLLLEGSADETGDEDDDE